MLAKKNQNVADHLIVWHDVVVLLTNYVVNLAMQVLLHVQLVSSGFDSVVCIGTLLASIYSIPSSRLFLLD